ncbi:MAG: response regulator [Gammaproteobacteria bacterium]|nr:response regulator [Gammaproteobacteria bacterium]
MSKTILVVDDSSSIRQLVSMSLRDAGFEVIEACDGKDALSKLAGQKVHLIVSDVNMPNMDGITLAKEVKAHPQYKFTPIMMLTTEAQESKMKEGKDAGANAWLTKPFQTDQLLTAVSRLA